MLLAVAVPLLVALTSAWSRGWSFAEVRTGSMRPGIRPGSMVVLAPVEPDDIRQGAVIGFRDRRMGGTVVTHRVVEVLRQPTGLFFRTQGDANATADGAPVAASQIVGQVRWRVAGLGAVSDAVTHPRVQAGLVAAPIGLFALSELVGLRERRKGKVIEALEADVARLQRELALARAAGSGPPPAGLFGSARRVLNRWSGPPPRAR